MTPEAIYCFSLWTGAVVRILNVPNVLRTCWIHEICDASYLGMKRWWQTGKGLKGVTTDEIYPTQRLFFVRCLNASHHSRDEGLKLCVFNIAKVPDQLLDDTNQQASVLALILNCV